MPITINGSGTVTGISAGGLPDACITTDDIAANAVTAAKLGADQASGLAKAWVNFNGTGTVAIRASFNVSSITDNGTGDYTVNFTTAMVDANYAADCTIQYDQAGSGVGGTYPSYSRNAPSATSARFHHQQNATLFDCTIMSVAIFR